MKTSMIGTAVVTALLTVACGPQNVRRDDGRLQREALVGVDRAVPETLPLVRPTGAAEAPEATEDRQSTGIAREVSRGTGTFIRPHAVKAPRPEARGSDAVTLNFEDQPVEAVVKAVLGDLLDANYSIAPGVQGSVSFSTAKPVARDEALPILETLLSWTGNALVKEHGRYSIVPSTQAVAGRLVPSMKAAKPAVGMGARLFPLRHVAAPAMAKLLAPFAAADAILLTDPSRNLLVIAGTRDELANYGETIDTFDVDWVSGMSVGVFSLRNATVGEVLPALEAVFGDGSGTPVAGMLRFIPIERTNAVVVISTQARHLDQVGDWIDRIDRGGGNEPRLFVYDVRNLLASDVARYVANVFGGSIGGDQGGQGGKVGPGLTAGEIGTASGFDGETDGGKIAAGAGSAVAGDDDTTFFQPPAPSGGGGSAGQDLRITAIDANNQLMVRARPSQWNEIRQAIERLDAVPLQVQIETRILEVRLRDAFRFGVQWYLEGLAGGNGAVTQPGNKQRWALGGAGSINARPQTFQYSFVNKDFQVVLRAMEMNGNTKTLSAPSLVVANNRKARIQVGNQIPVNSTYFSPTAGGGTPVTQVEYKDTGVILDVRPRVNPGGLVYLDVAQEVSSVDPDGVGQNLPISKKKLTTQVAVQSGQTVLLGGLIGEDERRLRNGVPFLSRIPLLGNLFSERDEQNVRSELIVLITPTVIANGHDAKRVSDEYRRAFRTLRPFEVTAVGSEAPDEKAAGET